MNPTVIFIDLIHISREILRVLLDSRWRQCAEVTASKWEEHYVQCIKVVNYLSEHISCAVESAHLSEGSL